jgi:hypothetical protein
VNTSLTRLLIPFLSLSLLASFLSSLLACLHLFLAEHIPHGFFPQLIVHIQTLQTDHRLLDYLHVFPTISPYLILLFHLSVQKHFSFLLLQYEVGLRYCVAILLFVVLNLAEGFAVEQQLGPCFRFLEDRKDVSVLEVVLGAWMYKGLVFQAVVFEPLQVAFGDTEGLNALLIFEFQIGFSRAILNQTEYLEDQLGVLNEATIATDLLILDLCLAHVAFVLDLDELDFNNEAVDLEV